MTPGHESLAEREQIPKLALASHLRIVRHVSLAVDSLSSSYRRTTGNLAHLLVENHCQVEVVRNDEAPAEVAALACGPATPLLDICLGHQAVARYHSLIVEETTLPPDLLVTARGPSGIPMALRHAHRPVEGLQFHPESILTIHGGEIIGNFIRFVVCQRSAAGAGRRAAGWPPGGRTERCGD